MILAGQNLLSVYPRGNFPFYRFVAVSGRMGPNHAARIRVGLEQAGDRAEYPPVDPGRLALVRQDRREPGRERSSPGYLAPADEGARGSKCLVAAPGEVLARHPIPALDVAHERIRVADGIA
jgi:hypothetical protein